MKQPIVNLALSLLVAVCFANALFAQNENFWIGGKSGRAADWNVASNWSKHRVPNETDDVVILKPNTSFPTYPYISGEVKVGSIYLESGAEIVLRDRAMLVVMHWRGDLNNGDLRSEPDAHALQIDTNKEGEVIAYQGIR